MRKLYLLIIKSQKILPFLTDKILSYFYKKCMKSCGNKVIFGPNPTIITGDHRIDIVGSYIYDNREKLPENDLPIVIEDDVWCGANMVILKGVTIGKGSVIAAGSVVNKSCDPYSIIGGIPAKTLKYRFSQE